jgi:hypothetical protein
MINIRTLKKLNNNDGLTLKKGKIIEYKTGWQVATEGVETCDLREAMKAIKPTMVIVVYGSLMVYII